MNTLSLGFETYKPAILTTRGYTKPWIYFYITVPALYWQRSHSSLSYTVYGNSETCYNYHNVFLPQDYVFHQ